MTGFELFPGVPAGGTGVIIVVVVIDPWPKSKKTRFYKVFWALGPKKSKRARFYKVFSFWDLKNQKEQGFIRFFGFWDFKNQKYAILGFADRKLPAGGVITMRTAH